jgi:regulator of nucleoside diphosphate kinase
MDTTRTISVTHRDAGRLAQLLEAYGSRGKPGAYATLEEELGNANLVDPKDIAPDVVTMNSRVLFEDVRTNEAGTVTIVYPADANPSEGRISVLSPVGAALLGEPEGRELELPLPHGHSRRIRIESVLYQPEARGDYAL